MTDDEQIAAALAHWPGLAAAAGLPSVGWDTRPLSLRRDARVRRAVLALRRGKRAVVLKHEARPVRPEDFAAALEAHRAAVAVFPQRTGLGIPAVLAADPAAQAAVYDFAPGRPLTEALEGAGATERAALLQRAGAWVAAFHRARPGEARVFQPRFSTRYLSRIRAELAEGARAIACPARFDACASALLDAAPRWEGRLTQAAYPHGDLHLRNLLAGEGGAVWGIDFIAKPGPEPVGHDVARLLVDLATLHTDPAQVPPGAVLAPADEAAFFAGYDLAGPDDPSIGYLLRHRLLADWWGLPAEDHRRSLSQARRLAGLLALAGRTFGV